MEKISVVFLVFLFLSARNSYSQNKPMSAKEMEESIETLNTKVSRLSKKTSKISNKSQRTQKIILDGSILEESYIGFKYEKLLHNPRLIAGSVVSMSEHGDSYELAKGGYNKRVIGVLTDDGKKNYFIATSGRVKVRVGCIIGEECSIKVGDLLVASNDPGVAMKCVDFNKSPGAIIGKALEDHENSLREGLIMVLLVFQ